MNTLFRDMEMDPVVLDAKVLKFVEQALPMCLEIPRTKKHVSFIVRKNKVLATGTNAFKGHPLARRIGYRFGEQHSELNALLKCCEKDKLTLINVRFNKNKEMRMARPCPLCLPWCTGVFDEIYYTCPDGQVRQLDTAVVKSNMRISGILRTG